MTAVVFRKLPTLGGIAALVFPPVACHGANVLTGEQIRAARERAHLSQQELANRLGVSMRTVGNWERGETVPRNRMAAIYEVLGVDDEPAIRDESIGNGNHLKDVPTDQLMAEISRRLGRSHGRQIREELGGIGEENQDLEGREDGQ